MGIFENTVMVDKKASMGNTVGRVICIVLIAVCLLISFTVPYGSVLFVPAILICVIFYLLHTNAQMEYEYTYIEGRLSVARIKAKRKRKELVKIEMEEVVLIAPETSAELETYKNNQSVTKRDLSSGMTGHKCYQVVYKTGNSGGITMIKFEPDFNMLELIQSRNPRKVIINKEDFN